MNTPDALERQVLSHSSTELLVRSHADVTWNDHIPDPDNPEQLRQIDITIRNDGKLTLIECRLSRRRQNVKWVEELIGRRQSLGAQEMIGVASAGFMLRGGFSGIGNPTAVSEPIQDAGVPPYILVLSRRTNPLRA